MKLANLNCKGNKVMIWNEEHTNPKSTFFCIHGLGGKASDFSLLAQNIISYDNSRTVASIGLNRKSYGGKIAGLGDFSAQVETVLKEMEDMPKPWFVVAHSMGTAVWANVSDLRLREKVQWSFLLTPPPLGKAMIPPVAMLRYAPGFLSNFLRPSGGLFTMPATIIREFLTEGVSREATESIVNNFQPESKKAVIETALGKYRVAEGLFKRSSVAVGALDGLLPSIPSYYKDVKMFEFGHMSPLFSREGSQEVSRWIDEKI